MIRKKNKNNNFQIIYGYFLLYILVKFKYRYQTVGQTVEVLMRLTYDEKYDTHVQIEKQCARKGYMQIESNRMYYNAKVYTHILDVTDE